MSNDFNDTDRAGLPAARKQADKEPRIIDMKTVLTSMLGAALTIAFALVQMYFQVGQMAKDVSEMQASVKSGNAQGALVASEVSLLKWRLDQVESSQARQRLDSPVPFNQRRGQ